MALAPQRKQNSSFKLATSLEDLMILSWKCVPALALAAAVILFAPITRAQEGSKVQTVEISPNHIQAAVGDKIKFQAVAKDASGQVVDVKPASWFAAPFDLAARTKTAQWFFINLAK